MPFLQLGTGGGAVVVEVTDASTGTPIPLGTETVSAANTLRSTINPAGQRRAWPFTTKPLTRAEYAALVALAPHGAYVLASGDAIGVGAGAAIECAIKHGVAPFQRLKDGWQIVLPFTLEETRPSGVTAPTGGTPT